MECMFCELAHHVLVFPCCTGEVHFQCLEGWCLFRRERSEEENCPNCWKLPQGGLLDAMKSKYGDSHPGILYNSFDFPYDGDVWDAFRPRTLAENARRDHVNLDVDPSSPDEEYLDDDNMNVDPSNPEVPPLTASGVINDDNNSDMDRFSFNMNCLLCEGTEHVLKMPCCVAKAHFYCVEKWCLYQEERRYETRCPFCRKLPRGGLEESFRVRYGETHPGILYRNPSDDECQDQAREVSNDNEDQSPSEDGSLNDEGPDPEEAAVPPPPFPTDSLYLDFTNSHYVYDPIVTFPVPSPETPTDEVIIISSDDDDDDSVIFISSDSDT